MPFEERIQKQQEKARAAAAPYLAPGERAVAVLTGIRPNYWFMFLGIIPYVLISTYFYLVVTDQGVLVIEISKYKSYCPKRLISRFSHADMQLGKPNFAGWATARVGGKSYSITGGKFLGAVFATAQQTLSAGASAGSAI
jgi:hypothetical protein